MVAFWRPLMPEFSVARLPEVFVSDKTISKNVHAAVAKGQLRKLGSRLYTRNLTDDPEKLVRRNWYGLVANYFPDAVIADRTALENRPAEDGRSEEHTSELQSLMRITYDVFCLKKKKT